MKLIALKEKDTPLTKKYIAVFVVLFVGALMVFVSHFYETPVTVSDVSEVPQFDFEKSEIGYLAPGFTTRDLKGNRVSLSDFKGQVVILNLWATWCGPCRVEMPSFESLYRRFRAEGLVVLAVSIDKGNDQEVRDFVDEYGLSFPVWLDPEKEVESRYPTFTIPTTFVIDRQGRVVAKVDGAKNWQSEETHEAVKFLLNKS